MNDIFFRRTKVDDFCDKFLKVPYEVQKLLFNYAYNSRERHGWFDALNMINSEDFDNTKTCFMKLAFEIANFETRCSHYGIAEKFILEINGRKQVYDFAFYDFSRADGDVNAANKIILVNTGLVFNVYILDKTATQDKILRPIFDYISSDFYENPYDFILKIFDYADGELGD